MAIGETWDEPFDVKVTLESGGTKSIQTRRHHKLAGVANGIATIEVTYQVLSPIDATIECQLVQRLMEGEVQFDIEAGRVVSQKMDIDKRILGFAGPTSSMQYVMRMEEKLADTVTPKVATVQQPQPTATQGDDKEHAAIEHARQLSFVESLRHAPRYARISAVESTSPSGEVASFERVRESAWR